MKYSQDPYVNSGNISYQYDNSNGISSELRVASLECRIETLEKMVKFYDELINLKNEERKNEFYISNNETISMFNAKIEQLENKIDKMTQSNNEKIKEIIFDVLRKCNKYIDDTTPWILAKDETKKDRLATVLYNLLESIRICAILLSPFMPTSVDKILYQLNTKVTSYDSCKKFGQIEINNQLNKPEPIFLRIDKKEE